MIRSAKQAFLESPHRIEHEKLVIKEHFQVACEYSLLALLQEMPEASSPSAGWDAHSQMVGARRVLDILKTLHQHPKRPEGFKSPGLNYKV